MRRWVLWLNVAERRLWGDALQGNVYFASFVIALSMFAGAALCERDMLAGMNSLFEALNGVALAGLLVVMSGFLMCESICVGERVDVAIIRTFAMVLLSSLVAVLGYLLGWPLLLLSTAWMLALWFFLFLDLRRR